MATKKKAAAAKPRFIKLTARGTPIKVGAKAFSQVLDTQTGLIWTAANVGAAPVPQAKADEIARACRVGGNKDWSLPTIEQLHTLIDYSRRDPAIDIDAFPSTKSGWYWTSTPLAGAEDSCAWFVLFGSGLACGYPRGSGGFVRAVRSVRAPSQ